jgi:hypothetical protein
VRVVVAAVPFVNMDAASGHTCACSIDWALK